jgi:outer membrane immunogenic protein
MEDMKHLLFTTALATLTLTSGTAFAADPVAEYTNDWSGFYVGVHAGYGFGEVEHSRSLCEEGCDRGELDDDFVDVQGDDFDDFEAGGSFSGDLDGFIGGAQLGANFVMGSGLLIGAEGSFSLAAITAKINNNEEEWDTEYEDDSPDFDVVMKDEMSNLGLAEAKLGFAKDAFAVYIKGGLALGDLSSSFDMVGDTDDDFTVESDSSSLRMGWTVGAGLDVMVMEGVSIGASYNYIDYGSELSSEVAAAVNSEEDDGLQAIVERDIDLYQHMVKVNLNYHF